MRAACTLLRCCVLQGACGAQARARMEFAIHEFERAQRRVDVCKKRLPLR